VEAIVGTRAGGGMNSSVIPLDPVDAKLAPAWM
jgi:hypothetical protein